MPAAPQTRKKPTNPGGPGSREGSRQIARQVVRFKLPKEYTDDKGRVWIDDASPLRDMTPGTRLRRIIGVMEAAAMAGDVTAAKGLLDFHRWRREMKEGRPRQRSDIAIAGSVVVVDTLGTPDAETARLHAAATGKTLTLPPAPQHVVAKARSHKSKKTKETGQRPIR